MFASGGKRAMAVSAVAVIAVFFTGYTWNINSARNQIQTYSVDNICPLASCVGYPVPSQVKGITVSAFQNYLLFNRSVKSQIRALKGWHANTVRFQILQDKLVGEKGNKFSPWYMRDVGKSVNFALRKGLTVVINAQTELSIGWAKNENLPDYATKVFWRHMTHRYGTNPKIVFDLFNEPRNCSWNQWQQHMQNLVTYVRSIGSENQLWVEGRWWGSTLEGVPMLKGQGIVYSFHHPGSPWPWQSPIGNKTWDKSFGYLTEHHIPVVDGEFVNYLGGYYWPHSTEVVAKYLSYLKAHKIGVVSWTLQAGVMTVNSNYYTAASEPQSAGRLIWRYYHGYMPGDSSGNNSVVTEHLSRGRSRHYRHQKYTGTH